MFRYGIIEAEQRCGNLKIRDRQRGICQKELGAYE